MMLEYVESFGGSVLCPPAMNLAFLINISDLIPKTTWHSILIHPLLLVKMGLFWELLLLRDVLERWE
jgi:hypothetical protein